MITIWNTYNSSTYFSIPEYTLTELKSQLKNLKYLCACDKKKKIEAILSEINLITLNENKVAKDWVLTQAIFSHALYVNFVENLRKCLEGDVKYKEARELVNYLIQTQISLADSTIQACDKCCTVRFVKDFDESVDPKGEKHYTCGKENEERCKDRQREIERKSWTHLSCLKEPFNYRLRRYIRRGTGMRYIEQIEDSTDEFLLGIPGIGKKGLADIRKAVSDHRKAINEMD